MQKARSYPGIETMPAAGLSTTVARAGVTVRPASATGRDPCRLRRRYRSSRVNNVQHLQLALLNSRSLSWQRPTTRDKLYDLISYVKKSKINFACISEMKNFNPEGESVSFVFVEVYMFILAESTGIIVDPMCRITSCKFKKFQEQAGGTPWSRCSGPTSNYTLGRCGHHDGLGKFDDQAKNGSIAMWCEFCGYPS